MGWNDLVLRVCDSLGFDRYLNSRLGVNERRRESIVGSIIIGGSSVIEGNLSTETTCQQCLSAHIEGGCRMITRPRPSLIGSLSTTKVSCSNQSRGKRVALKHAFRAWTGLGYASGRRRVIICSKDTGDKA